MELHSIVVLLVVCCIPLGGATDWDSLTKILDTAIANRVFPGCTAAVFTKDKLLYGIARGSFTYGIPPPQTPDHNPPVERTTLFDMASCSKIVAGTTAAALLYQRGLLDLNAKVSRYVPGYDAGGKADVTIRNILLHNAGLPADPIPGYYQTVFGCPEAGKQHPALTFSCADRCYAALLAQTLKTPPGQTYVYSDIGFMTVSAMVGHIARDKALITAADLRSDCPITNVHCYYEAFVRKYIFTELGMSHSAFLPDPAKYKTCAPTENDTFYRHQIVQGVVHDENTYAMGGISGHAGLFSTVDDVVAVARQWLFATASSSFLNSTTTKLWTTVQNRSQSSRALGWDTAMEAPDSSCGSLSTKTFMHTGFTGTLICADPERSLGVVLLTNRVYPSRDNAAAMYQARKAFTTQVQVLFDSQKL